MRPWRVLVDELGRAFADPEFPAGHRCAEHLGYAESSYEPRATCSHVEGARASLLERLRSIVVPGTAPGERERGGPSKRRAGSPAPWDPSAAELVDEVLRGALRMSAQARAELGFSALTVRSWLPLPAAAGPTCPLGCDHRSCAVLRLVQRPVHVAAERAPLDEGGLAALRDLPDTVGLLEERHPEHALVRGRPVDPDDLSMGWHAGEVERRVRGWHARALQVLGWGQQLPRRLWMMPNPMQPEDRVWSGPVCHERLRTSQVTCGHLSCLRAAYSAMGEWAPMWCPWCWHRSLVEDPVTGVVSCPRTHPDRRARVEWSSEARASASIAHMIRRELELR